jgi:hypothetical protein
MVVTGGMRVKLYQWSSFSPSRSPAALDVARQSIDDEPLWLGLVAGEGQNLLVQIGYALQPARVN